eukprot:scaffold5146_cov164-Ochromonas_danica.AAC.1
MALPHHSNHRINQLTRQINIRIYTQPCPHRSSEVGCMMRLAVFTHKNAIFSVNCDAAVSDIAEYESDEVGRKYMQRENFTEIPDFHFTTVRGLKEALNKLQEEENLLLAQALNEELIVRIRSSVLFVSNADDEVIPTAIVWDYTSEDVLLLTNYHTWDQGEFRYCCPPKDAPPPAKKQKKGKMKSHANDEYNEQDPAVLKLHNEDEFQYNFVLTSDFFTLTKRKKTLLC